MDIRIEKYKKELQLSGYKLTSQREATLKTLILHENDHLSAEDVYMNVLSIAPDMGIATVYRTLELFCDIKIVDKVSFGDGVARYDLRSDKDSHCHSHMICISCGKVEEINEDVLGNLEQFVKNNYQFEVKNHSLTFQGLCKNCRN